MKKLLVVLCAVLLFTGCSCSLNDTTSEDAVVTFFEKYKDKDETIMSQLEDVIKGEELTDTAKEEYRGLLEKQYEEFDYEIKNIKQDENEATATVEVTVLNYRSGILLAEEYLTNNPKEFNDENGVFLDSKYTDYKIDQMSSITDTTSHTIELHLTKENGLWKVDQLSSDDLSKLHGLY